MKKQKGLVFIKKYNDNKTIIEKLKRYLDNPEELEKVSYRGWMLMQKYTQEWYASVFINNISKIKQ